MNTLTVPRPRPSPLDRIFRLHTPSWRTSPPSCITCGTPILTLASWLNSECLGEPAADRRVA